MTVIDVCKKYLGTPYVWGGESKSEGGFDCSGYIYNALNESGVKVSRLTAQGYYDKFKNSKGAKNVAGSLLFFGKSVNNITHVAIAEGDGTHMYESIGRKSNTKSNPGKGVTRSLITRRKDLVAMCLPKYERPKNVSRETLATPTLRRGDMGVEVNRLQKCLNLYGYGLKVDGKFGPKTFNAVVDYQKKRGLVKDGIYGPLTHNKMRSELWK